MIGGLTTPALHFFKKLVFHPLLSLVKNKSFLKKAEV
jgi:hypothetical protein